MSEFHPKGGMCTTCKYSRKMCKNLRFDKMPILKIQSDGIKIVKCTNWQKVNTA